MVTLSGGKSTRSPLCARDDRGLRAGACCWIIMMPDDGRAASHSLIQGRHTAVFSERKPTTHYGMSFWQSIMGCIWLYCMFSLGVLCWSGSVCILNIIYVCTIGKYNAWLMCHRVNTIISPEDLDHTGWCYKPVTRLAHDRYAIKAAMISELTYS